MMKSLSKIVLFDIDYTLFDTTVFKDSGLTKYSLYDEVVPTLTDLAKIAELGIFSKGESEFQNAKLQKTGIRNLFKPENIHIFEDKDENLKSVVEHHRGQSIYLVDDKLEILYSAKQYNSAIFTVWIKRGPFAEDETLSNSFSPEFMVKNLTEIISIILGN